MDLHIVAKGMTRLDKQINRLICKKAPDLYTTADYYGNEQLSEDIYPVQFKRLKTEQQKDKKLIEKAKTSKA
eukprot:6612064-Ditylum_brightwellii.AAC.1